MHCRKGGQDPTTLLSPEQLCFQTLFIWSLCLDSGKGIPLLNKHAILPRPTGHPPPRPRGGRAQEAALCSVGGGSHGQRTPHSTSPGTPSASEPPTESQRSLGTELGQPVLSTEEAAEHVTGGGDTTWEESDHHSLSKWPHPEPQDRESPPAGFKSCSRRKLSSLPRMRG